MAAESYEYRWIKNFVEPLVGLLQVNNALSTHHAAALPVSSLFNILFLHIYLYTPKQRDQADVSERVLKTLQLMFNAEPVDLVDMIGYGTIPALYSTFFRFRQHDNVLANVYGMVSVALLSLFSFNAALVHS